MIYHVIKYSQNPKEERRIFLCIVREDPEIHRFINEGNGPEYRRGPGDETGASYAFSLYDFIKGTYRYTI